MKKETQNQPSTANTNNVESFRSDLLDFMEGYYSENYECSAEAAFEYFLRMRALAFAKKNLLKASDKQIIADHTMLMECMTKLYDDFSGNHDKVKKSVDACIDRYIPGLRKYRESVLSPDDDTDAAIPASK